MVSRLQSSNLTDQRTQMESDEDDSDSQIDSDEDDSDSQIHSDEDDSDSQIESNEDDFDQRTHRDSDKDNFIDSDDEDSVSYRKPIEREQEVTSSKTKAIAAESSVKFRVPSVKQEVTGEEGGKIFHKLPLLSRRLKLSVDQRGKGRPLPLECIPNQPAKKPRLQKERMLTSPKVILDGFTRVEYEAYLEDPFAACMQVGKYGSDLLNKWKAEAEERQAEMTKEQDRLRLQRDELQKKLTEAETALEHLKKDRTDAIIARMDAKSKARDAEKKIKGLEANSTLQNQLTELETQKHSLEVSLDKARKERDEARLQVKGVARKAVDFTKCAFQNALDQVRCLDSDFQN